MKTSILTIFMLLIVSFLTSCTVSDDTTLEENAKVMHSSWDLDNDGINDCEKEGICDDSVDYTIPKQ